MIGPNLGPGQLINPAIPSGFGKYTTDTFRSPAGDFKMHFYKNPTAGEAFYGLDYKAIFNSMSGVLKKPLTAAKGDGYIYKMKPRGQSEANLVSQTV